MGEPTEGVASKTDLAASSKTTLYGSLSQMFLRLRSLKYKPSSQEANVWKDCKSRVDKHRTRGFIIGGCILGAASNRFKLLGRLTITTVGATIGGFVAARGAVKPCVEDILSLDGSRFQQELSTILLRDQAHRPLVQKLLLQHYYLERVYDDSSGNMPSLRLRKRTFSGEVHYPIDTILESADSKEDSKILEQKFSNQHTQENVSDRDNTGVKPYSDIPNSKMNMHEDRQIRQREEKMAEEADFSLDLFNISTWGTSEEDSSKQKNEGQILGRCRKRMTINERRQYNRERYVQWKQRQQQAGS